MCLLRMHFAVSAMHFAISALHSAMSAVHFAVSAVHVAVSAVHFSSICCAFCCVCCRFPVPLPPPLPASSSSLHLLGLSSLFYFVRFRLAAKGKQSGDSHLCTISLSPRLDFRLATENLLPANAKPLRLTNLQSVPGTLCRQVQQKRFLE